MSTPVWTAGTLYAPGSLVQPRSTVSPIPVVIGNGDFESGNTGWTLATGFSITEPGAGSPEVFQGSWSMRFNSTTNNIAVNNTEAEIVPGQTINASCYVRQFGSHSFSAAGVNVAISWYDNYDALISITDGPICRGINWQQATITAVAPSGATKARFTVRAYRASAGNLLVIDTCAWDALTPPLAPGLVFKAVQAVAGYSASNEPVWPTVNGDTVVDNQVTWEAVFASRVVWEASPILVSGEYEPEFPEQVGASVADGSISWTALDARVADAPQSKITAIAASKVYKGDDDIVPYCATANPLDWTSPQDAGYIPFGLNTYGATPVSALGLYRSNLVVFNSQGFQMWQVDQDPANNAILDAAPVPCEYKDTVQPVSNDLVFLTSRGIRNISIAGASTNLQAGYFGKQVDPLVLELLAAATTAGFSPLALFYPGAGQYWVIFGTDVMVLTMNGGSKDQSWSRYKFPSEITDWAILGTDLYLRSGDLVWRVSEDATADDVVCAPNFRTALASSSVNGSNFTATEDWAFGAGDFTVESWFQRVGAVDNEQYRVLRARALGGGAQSGWEFQIRFTGTDLLALRLLLRPASTSFTFTSASFAMPDGEWFHAAISVDTNTNIATFYVNGVSIGTADITTGAGDVGRATTMSIMQAIAGECDELRVWTVARTAQQIADCYQFPYEDLLDTTGCIAAFQFNEGSGTTTTDTVNGIIATLVSGATFVDGPTPPGEGAGGNPTASCEGTSFTGYMAWPYLDMGRLGITKNLEGFDLVGTGEVAVSIGYDQRNAALATTPYTIDADTLPGNTVPIPISAPSFQFRLTWSADQKWEWNAAALYMSDQLGGS